MTGCQVGCTGIIESAVQTSDGFRVTTVVVVQPPFIQMRIKDNGRILPTEFFHQLSVIKLRLILYILITAMARQVRQKNLSFFRSLSSLLKTNPFSKELMLILKSLRDEYTHPILL